MNNYHFYEEEAKGKYSVIFKARKKRKLDFVAIKRMDKTRRKKVLNEARILSELSHPNIVKFYEYIESKNHMWAVSEYCPGGDLLKLIEQDKSLPENIVQGFTVDILKGLLYCHSKGIVICDLKPASVLINEYGTAKIGDFGSSRSLMDLMHAQKQSKKGTPSYMAPELFILGGVYSFQSDLWSVGCIMYELAQGNPPFVSTSYQEIANLAFSSSTPKVEQFSSDFNNLLENLLAKNPEDRISWEALVHHPWIGNQLDHCDVPEQPHFRSYCLAKKQSKQDPSNMKLLRASQQFRGKQDYEKQNQDDGSLTRANDRRGEFVFQNEDGYPEDFAEDEYNYNPDQKITLDDKSMIGTGFMKKKESGIAKVQSKKQKIAKQSPLKHKDKAKEKEKDKDKEKAMMEDSSNVNMFLETISRKNLIPLNQLMQHQSDNAVKPIIGNKDIEVIQSFNFNKKGLGFSYIDPETLAEGIINGEMEEELQSIFDGMIGDEKYNVMGYFQSIIQNSDVANYLFKENFIKFYMKLMKGYKQAALRAKMFQIMGFLVRHATVIDPAIMKHGIINAFIQGATKDKSEKVRRKAMAALGELLFYGATQVDEGVDEWNIPLSLIHSLLKILKNTQEDEVVRVYCCKSIQNITAQAKEVGKNFSQIDILMVLISCFNTTRNQGFKTSICCCFHHVIELNGSLREILLEKIGLENVVQAIKNPECSGKTLQILLWIMLTQFLKSKTSKISRMYLDDENLFKAIMGKLDVISSSTARGRIYLYINFYLEADPRRCLVLLENNSNMVAINNSKIFTIVEKQSAVGGGERQSKYETQCIQYILVWLYENFHNIIKLIHEDIKICLKQANNANYSEGKSKRSTGYCGVLWHMTNCPIFEELFSSEGSMDNILSILSLLDQIPPEYFSHQISQQPPVPSVYSNNNPNTLHSLQSIKSIYSQILQKLTNNSVISEKLQEHYATKILPFFVGRILKSQHQDIKFNCMKYFLYLVSFYLNQDYLYDSTILNTTSHKIVALIVNHLLPEIGTILVSEKNGEAIPTMAIKLLAVLFEINDVFVKKFYELGLMELVIVHYREGCNVNVLKLVQKVMAITPKQEPQDSGWIHKVMKRTIGILLNYIQTNQEVFLQYPLQTLGELMRIGGKYWKQDEVIDSIWEKVVQLQGHEDMLIREKGEEVVKTMLENNRYGSRGKWEVKEKRGLDNYDRYMQLTGGKRDPKIGENIKAKTTNNSRYN